MIETLALPDPLHDTNGRRAFEAIDDLGGVIASVVTAPASRLYIVGRYESHPQAVDVDPDGLTALGRALEAARLYSADGRVIRPAADSTVIGALRLALVEGYAPDDRALDVARKILETAAATDSHSTAPTALLVELLRDGELTAKVTTSTVAA